MDYFKILLLLIVVCIIFLLCGGPPMLDKVITYYIHDSDIDSSFKLQTSLILEHSKWRDTHNIMETQDVNKADVQIWLRSDESLDDYHREKKYYPDQSEIRFSITVQSPYRKPRIFINAKNWQGVPASGLSLSHYRRYVVEHEFGHALGFHHQKCDHSTANNGVCPVMYQSTVGCPTGFKCGWSPIESDRNNFIKHRYLF